MSENLTLFDRFGGTRKMAEMLGEAPSTVQSWKSAGRVPAAHQPKVLERAVQHGIAIEAEDVVFPMGRDTIPEGISASATNSAENIREGEAYSRRPFAHSLPISTPTSALLPSSADSRACSLAGEAEAG